MLRPCDCGGCLPYGIVYAGALCERGTLTACGVIVAFRCRSTMELFPDPSEMGVVPVLFMLCVYGYVLFTASGTIAQGSEMLLLIYGPGIIGGLVRASRWRATPRLLAHLFRVLQIIPILGAIPDCMIILLSGMGMCHRRLGCAPPFCCLTACRASFWCGLVGCRRRLERGDSVGAVCGCGYARGQYRDVAHCAVGYRCVPWPAVGMRCLALRRSAPKLM